MATFPNIALMGRARSGKDTVASHLMARFAYSRVSFADPLKELALRVDPWVPMDTHGTRADRLSYLVEHFGWEAAKDKYPEVRRTLQHLGTGIRDIDMDFWAREGLRKADIAASFGVPAIFTDVRFPNEYESLHARGFRMVRVLRTLTTADGSALHVSETALDSEIDYPADYTVINSGTLADLRDSAERLAHV